MIDPQRTAVVTLVQAEDFPTAWSSLFSVEGQLSARRRRFVLLNDPVDRELCTQLEQLTNTELVFPGRNLGVARGRNRLFEMALKWGADLIVTLDDDLLVPSDYLDLVEQLMSGAGLEQGRQPDLASPVLLDYHTISPSIHDANQVRRVEVGEYELLGLSHTNADLVGAWIGLEEPARSNAIHHMGIRDWRRHYFAPLGPAARQVRAVVGSVVNGSMITTGGTRPTQLREDPSAVHLMEIGEESYLPIDCAPGGSTVYRSDALDKVGLLEEAFSPFGYEDSEICIRARSAGLEVLLLPQVVLLHDLQSRHKTRSPLVAPTTRAKARVLLTRLHGGDATSKASEILESLVIGLLEATMYPHVAGGAFAAGLAFVAGLFNGFFVGTTSKSASAGPPSQAGSYISLGRAEFHTIRQHAETGNTPRLLSGSVPLTIRLRSALGTAALRSPLRGRANLTYEMTPGGTLILNKLGVEFPGLFRLEMSGLFHGLSFDDGPGDPLGSISVESFRIVMNDHGFIDGLEDLRAWLGGWPSTGVFRSMAARLPGPQGTAIRAFLEPWQGAKSLEVVMSPESPVQFSDLAGVDGGPWHVMNLLGLRVRVGEGLPSISSS